MSLECPICLEDPCDDQNKSGVIETNCGHLFVIVVYTNGKNIIPKAHHTLAHLVEPISQNWILMNTPWK